MRRGVCQRAMFSGRANSPRCRGRDDGRVALHRARRTGCGRRLDRRELAMPSAAATVCSSSSRSSISTSPARSRSTRGPRSSIWVVLEHAEEGRPPSGSAGGRGLPRRGGLGGGGVRFGRLGVFGARAASGDGLSSRAALLGSVRPAAQASAAALVVLLLAECHGVSASSARPAERAARSGSIGSRRENP